MAYEGSTEQRCLATGRCHFDRENSKEHGELIFKVFRHGIMVLIKKLLCQLERAVKSYEAIV